RTLVARNEGWKGQSRSITSGLELQQDVHRRGELVATVAVIERRLIGEVAAKFRTDPNPGARMVIQAAGDFAVVVGGGADAGAVDVVEPFNAVGDVELRRHVQNEDVVGAPPLAGAHAGA